MSGLPLGLIAGSVIGSATVLGACAVYRKPQSKANIWEKLNLDFAIGMMLAAAAFNLIAPAYTDTQSLLPISLALILGVFTVKGLSHLIHSHHSILEKSSVNNNAALFIIAMMLHNLPEGLAAGASFQSETLGSAQGWSILAALVIQNIPEGLATAFAFRSLGISKSWAFIAASGTGLVELFGGAIGGAFSELSSQVLPLTLAFAGGAMISVTLDELLIKVKSTHMKYLYDKSFVSGFLTILVMNLILG